MTSHLPGACCLIGFKHEGDPIGEMRNIGEVRAYVSEPDNSQKNGKAVLYLSDIFGIYNNSKLLADQFAAQGYTTVIPDLLTEDQLPLDVFEIPDFDIQKWAVRHGPDAVDPIVEETINYIRNTLGFAKVAAVGYCFGGKYVARFLKDGKLDSGYTAHPSFITETELCGIQRPFSIAAAEIDHIFPPEERHRSEEILIKTKQRYQINLFGGVEHGFAVRGDPKDSANRFSKEQAFLQAVAWFDYTI